MEQKTTLMPAAKRVALIAHDNRKDLLLDWCQTHLQHLHGHTLFATGTTGRVLEKALGISVNKLISGPLGGDQQIGAMVTERQIDVMIFFWDPFEPMPHDPDVKALLRVAAVWNIPVACSRASADFLITSPFMQQEYEYQIPDYDAYLASRGF
ncbi:methylglyoxal synthase [Pokkaliibacter plantistimulans]|uniref:Methylglyoxal synthase n=1 Tax=Pokkaliibacter plantistimulans TaxID=1635171 RepID=A0ABX5LT56_9GAMM|nr:methylglyoxal synthase [Pokkaliibacter plantistimulans]